MKHIKTKSVRSLLSLLSLSFSATMSQPSGSGRVKRRRVKTEEQIVKEILKLQKLLMKEHKTASLFTYSSKFGLMRFGSDNVVEKFKEESDDWIEVFEKDDEELINDIQIQNESDTDDAMLNDARASLLPTKLPALVSLMKYEELWKWISQEALKEHWRNGGQSKCIKWGHAEFEPSFWLGEVWDWQSITKHPKDLSRASYTGPGNMTEFLKKVVMNKLGMLGINPDMWISEKFTDEEKKRRERSRKKVTANPIEDDINSDGGNDVDADVVDQEEASNQNVMNETFAAEHNLEDFDESPNISHISGPNQTQSSGPVMTSSVNEKPQRRMSQRQAEKRKRIENLETLDEEDYVHDEPQLAVPQHVHDPPQGDGPSRSQPKFIPRRRPLPAGHNGNFCSPLLVNVGEKNNDYVEMMIPNNLVSEFEMLSRSNSEHRVETGGILGGIREKGVFKITHLLVPEQNGSHDC